MSETVIITAPPGLSVGDFAFRLYKNGTAQSTAGLGVTELAVDSLASNYVVTGRPTPNAGDFWTLTWNDGTQRGARRYPAHAKTPPNLILPLRQSGVVIADLGAKLYLDGASVSTSALTLTSLGSPFDYKLLGLPTPASGSQYTLSYSFGAAYFTETWPTLIGGINTPVPSGTYYAFQAYRHALRAMFDEGMQAVSPATLIYWENASDPYLPGATTKSSKPTQSKGTAPWLRFTTLTADNPYHTQGFREHYGRVILQAFAPQQTGPQANEALLVTIDENIFSRKTRNINEPSNVLKITGTRIKEVGPEPEGWFQTNYEASFSWTQAA